MDDVVDLGQVGANPNPRPLTLTLTLTLTPTLTLTVRRRFASIPPALASRASHPLYVAPG